MNDLSPLPDGTEQALRELEFLARLAKKRGLTLPMPSPRTHAESYGPQEGPQTDFLQCGADIAIMGGAAGGGKTWGLLLEASRHTSVPNFSTVTFRRTFPQIRQEGGLWDGAAILYPPLGAVPHLGLMAWQFLSGSRVRFAHMHHEDDRFNYQGAQIALLAFDQLEQFTRSQFFYMLGRNRSTCGVRPYIRATCNPDPESWLADFVDWWIDQETGYASAERAGKVRWFIKLEEDELCWADSLDELVRQNPTWFKNNSDQPPRTLAKSVAFFPATIYDNPALIRANPEYLANLLALDHVERERLLKGNWKVRAEAGQLFNRGWFEVVNAVPAGGTTVRAWDFAATERKMADSRTAATAAILMRKVKGVYYILDCIEVFANAADVDRMVANMGRQDAVNCEATGSAYMLRWEREPGSAGKREDIRLRKLVAPLDGRGIPPQGDKIQRAKGFASQAQAGNVKVLEGPWNEKLLQHLHHQPQWKRKDIMDACSLAFNTLATGVWVRGPAAG